MKKKNLINTVTNVPPLRENRMSFVTFDTCVDTLLL